MEMGRNSEVALDFARRWSLVLKYGDEPGIAYRIQAVASRLRGKWRQSVTSFLRASELSANAVNREAWKIGAIDSLARAGEIDEAIALGRQISARLTRLGEHGLAKRAMLNVGNALLWADRDLEAKPWFHKASDSPEDSIRAGALLGLSTVTLFRGKPKDAEVAAVNALELCESRGWPAYAEIARGNLGHAELRSGRVDQAIRTFLLIRSREALLSATDQVRLSLFLGEAYLAANLWTAAEQELTALVESPHALTLNRGDGYFGRALARRRMGDAQAAVCDLRKARQMYRRSKNLFWAAMVDLELRASGLRTKIPDHKLLAQDPRVGALLAINFGRAKSSRAIKDLGFSDLVWLGAYQAALASDRPLDHYRRMFRAMVDQRALTSSLGVRTAFFADKQAALESYMRELLTKPTRKRTEELIRVISLTRAVSLIDEIIGARRTELSALKKVLDDLRGEFGDEQDRAEIRGSAIPHRPTRLARHALATIERSVATPRGVHTRAHQGLLITCVGDQIWSIGDGPELLPVDTKWVANEIGWLRFDILAPISTNLAEAEVLGKLAAFRKSLGLKPPNGVVCPDGPLLDLPWGAMFPEMPFSLSLTTGGAARLVTQIRKVLIVTANDSGLPSIQTEVAAVLKRFPDAVIVNTAASLQHMLREHWDLIHVAAHASHNHQNPMFSTLQVGEETVFAAEIAAWRPVAKLVILSACETGRLSLGEGEPDGIVRAFLAGGTLSVIGSGWQVDDEASARFVAELLDALETMDDVAHALVIARKNLRLWKNHPYYWGAWLHFVGYA
jgi:tetratricopeptide (TPR) repeat protein